MRQIAFGYQMLYGGSAAVTTRNLLQIAYTDGIQYILSGEKL